MKVPLAASIFSLLCLTSAKLIVDYKGGDDVSNLGQPQYEGQNLGDHVPSSSKVFIKPDQHGSSRVLHYHRDPHYRRAEVKAKGDYSGNKHYYIGYKLGVTNIRSGLVIFQWKRQDKYATPADNIPFQLVFDSDKRLNLEYTTPGGSGSNRRALWKGDFSEHTAHNIAISFTTGYGNSGSLQLWIDGRSVFYAKNLALWTGETYPKFGIYRAEAAAGGGNDAAHTFDSWVYRVQISDKSLDEISASSGLGGGSRQRRDLDQRPGSPEDVLTGFEEFGGGAGGAPSDAWLGAHPRQVRWNA